ncbi:hypothetical protein [Tautonia sociabilis]|uniref:Uncharacterized protein n=1 Tax=Tautonia sociabilis TaxID=2080755 RepID=A0A432ME35_9BACT|nr:hypothetical protein [Tautonia sociabilis]RUL83414.1 hypothetical protein TsocGM_22145 [Tautonia sociabilis]
MERDEQGEGRTTPVRPDRRGGARPTIAELMLLIGGVGLGLAVAIPPEGIGPGDQSGAVLVLAGAVLGGASLVGVPLLLWERRRRPRRRFGPGRLSWFAHGTAAWLLWPPIVIGRRSEAMGRNPPAVDPSVPMVCYYYGTPLMAVYVTLALLAGGWIGPRRRRHRSRRPAPLPWRERFGLLLGLGWALVGLYVLSMVYRSEFR